MIVLSDDQKRVLPQVTVQVVLMLGPWFLETSMVDKDSL
jgi:hypothetical protein